MGVVATLTISRPDFPTWFRNSLQRSRQGDARMDSQMNPHQQAFIELSFSLTDGKDFGLR